MSGKSLSRNPESPGQLATGRMGGKPQGFLRTSSSGTGRQQHWKQHWTPIIPFLKDRRTTGHRASQNARLRIQWPTRDGSTSKASLCSLLRHATGGLEGIGGVNLCVCGGRDSFRIMLH